MAIKYDKILNDIREVDTTTKGDTGVDGDTGVAGPKGDTGTQGDTGAGLQGDTGADSTVQGDTGVKGDTGVQGDSGYVGSDGDTGVKGDTGSTGAKGDTGTAGSQGDTGSTGSQGDQGDTGSTGSAGAKGDTGVAGSKGDTGTTGNQGDTGSAGAQGDTGTTGSAGSQGDTGVQGDTGAGVQGDTGTAGSQGDTGVTGDTGTQYPWDGAWVTSTAYAVNDCVEYQGSGYVCVTAHTSGTFATDLSAGKWELLVEKGDQGDTGTAGAKGDTGTAGAKGDTGTAGAKGDTGTAGAKGDTGTAGTQGDTGVTGAVGDTGVQGDTGIAPTDTHVMGEVPTGTVNGTNTDFDVSNTPASGSLRVYVNGVRMKVTDDYSLSGTTITFVTAPETGDKILCDYFTTAGEIAQGSTSFVYDETPGGTVNSSNTSFTIANTPVSGTLQLYRDGQLLKGGSADYSLSGTTITMTTAPTTGSVLSAFYQQSLTVAGNADTLDSYHADTFIDALESGWFAAGETWTYASSDDPTYTLTISGDKTSKYSAGMRVKLTDSGTQYFIITKVAYSSPDTTLTLYGGTDYDLSTGTITSPYFSSWKAPQGFPLDPTKWGTQTTGTSLQSQASPVSGTWYNVGSRNIVVPIGAWKLGYKASFQVDGAISSGYITLSTANNSESDVDFSLSNQNLATSHRAQVDAQVDKYVTLTSKTTYYLNLRFTDASPNNLYLRGDMSQNRIFYVCAYL